MAAKDNLRAGLAFLVWAVLLLWPVVLHPNQPLMAPGAQFSDLLISHWPNAEFLRRSLLEYHQFPLWNPMILNGAPFAADPLAGLWYLPNWLTIILPLPFAFNLLLVLHLAWGGWGMFRWAQADGFGWLPSLVGGLGYVALPKVIAHLAAGHISLVFAVAWMPWLLTAVGREGSMLRRVGWVAVFWAMIFLADVRWGVYAGLVLVVWWVAQRGFNRNSLAGLGLCIITFLLLTAVLWIPMAEFVQHSSRTGLTAENRALYSLPLNYLVGAIIPNLGGFHEYMTYVGLLPFTLAIVGAVKGKERVGKLTMIGLAIGALWWALGPSAGLFTLVGQAPGFSLLRVPSRFLFIYGLAVCWLAVRGTAAIQAGFRLQGRGWNLAIVGMLSALWIITIGGSLIVGKPLLNLIVTAGAGTVALLALRLKLPIALLPVLLGVELLVVNSTLIESRVIVRDPVADWLAEQPDPWRVYSPSYSLPTLDATQLNLQQADGVNPLQLAETTAYMEVATGVKGSGYSVTVPAFEGDVATANAEAIPNADLLGRLNVRYVVSEFEIDADGLELVSQIGNTRIYQNSLDEGRVQGGELVSWSPNRIALTASGPGTVTLAEVWYPGWVATVDGKTMDVERDGIFRSITVSDGSHQVVFEFRPVTVYVGLLLSLFGLGLVSFLVRWVK